jgi:hypothetical protein
VTQYCGLVDANALCFMWPQELEHYRLLFVSGPASQPMFSVFTPSTTTASTTDHVEVILHCNGSHFTLLRPHPNLLAQFDHYTDHKHDNDNNDMSKQEFRIIDRVLSAAKAAEKVVVSEYAVQASDSLPSIRQIMKLMLNSTAP